jgi:hypothetical protein
MRTHTFFGNSDKDFYCEKNNILQVYTYVLTYNHSLQPLILYTFIKSKLQPTILNDNVNQFKVGLESDKGYFTISH